MNVARPHAERLIALSLALYQALLLLYPARFRHAYGAQMAQVFRATCRAAEQQNGFAGIARIWRVTLGDLIVSALAERMEQNMSMTRNAWYRAAGIVSLVGVAVWILGTTGLTLGMTLAMRMGAMAPLGVTMAVPLVWLFFVVGLAGLSSWLAEQRGTVVWLPGAVAMATLIALMVASLYSAYASQIGIQNTGAVTVVNLAARSSVNEQTLYYSYSTMNLSYPLLGLALVVMGLLIRRLPALRGVTRMLLVMGIAGMLYYFFTDMGAPSLLRNTGMPGLIGMMAGALAFFAVWLIGWVALGRRLIQAGALQQAAQPQTHPAANLPASD